MEEEIVEIKDEVINKMGDDMNNTKSYHIFLFPFKWDFFDKKIEKPDFENRVQKPMILTTPNRLILTTQS